MTLRLPLPDGSAPHVLVVEPGPRASETVQSLLDQGARVDVQSPAPDARLVDLAGRRLITLHTEDDLDTGRYDIVLRDPLRAAATAKAGPRAMRPGKRSFSSCCSGSWRGKGAVAGTSAEREDTVAMDICWDPKEREE